MLFQQYRAWLWLAFSTPLTSCGFVLLSPIQHDRGVVCLKTQQQPEKCDLQSSRSTKLSAGFGSGSGGGARAPPEAPGAAEAKSAIESSGGDLNRATSIVFQRRLSKLQQENEELSVMLQELPAAWGFGVPRFHTRWRQLRCPGERAAGSWPADRETPRCRCRNTFAPNSGGGLPPPTTAHGRRSHEQLGEVFDGGAGNARLAGPVENEELHEALVSATWDAVAVMNALPKSRSTSMEAREEKRISKRLKAIAAAARLAPLGTAAAAAAATAGGGEGGVSTVETEAGAAVAAATAPFAGKILDMGCGDGTLMPHLVDQLVGGAGKSKPKKGKGGKKRKVEASQQAQPETPPSGSWTTVREVDVTGVDLSEVMISAAKQKYPKARWLTGNVLALSKLLGLHQPEPLFSSIIFNGSLQFFLDPVRALADAKEWLMDGGHIVIAHVQGSDFVRDECRKNPRVAPSPMPGREGMEEWAATIGCSLLEGPDDLSQRDFLLQIMRKM